LSHTIKPVWKTFGSGIAEGLRRKGAGDIPYSRPIPQVSGRFDAISAAHLAGNGHGKRSVHCAGRGVNDRPRTTTLIWWFGLKACQAKSDLAVSDRKVSSDDYTSVILPIDSSDA
jgi:hypothetical protein